MERGKIICETLKGIRQEIAQANEIDYSPTQCRHEGDCAGTCPKCESEMRWLEGQLRLRKSLGKAVTIAGLSLSLASLSSCTCSSFHQRPEGDVPMDTTEAQCDTFETGEVNVNEFQRAAEPAVIDGVTQPEDPNDNRDISPK
ncbi:MAG: hypothetical protein J6S96_02965 [Muribaculaceae bacterium]|nr:hypothetical protein [Muribaculaceae bacterium]